MIVSRALLGMLVILGTAIGGTGANPMPQNPSITPDTARCLVQTDFDQGTVIINQPGAYRLCENISFKPNPPADGESASEAFQPDFSIYDESNYGLGFFAAISVVASGVDIFLDGYTIEQSREHALMQRFFAIIELGQAPFIEGVGPHNFGTYTPATDVRILGPGTMGLSSHHAIHGNDNDGVEIRDIEFVDFEVAAVSLNNVDNLEISNNKIWHNRHDAPVVGMFSAAVFISKYGNFLRDHYPNRAFTPGNKSVKLYNALIDSIDAVYDEVVNGDGTTADPLFRNPLSVPDGPCYAFVVHGKGPAVNGFGEIFEADETTTSSNIIIEDNIIENIKCWTKEIPAAVINGAVQNDARGAVFQLVDTFTGDGIAMDVDGKYAGNPVANMQLFVAEAILDGTLQNDPVLNTGVNTISNELIQWAKDGTVLDPYIRCNGDSMHHVGKGIVAIRVEDTINFLIRNNVITTIENKSVKPFSDCDDLHLLASSENAGEQQMGNVRGISIAAFRDNPEVNGVKGFNSVEENTITSVSSDYPGYKVIGVDVQGESGGILIQENTIDLVDGPGPVGDPQVIGIRVRQNADNGSIKVKDKSLVDEGVVLEYLGGDNGNGHGRKLEAIGGGCPFAQGGYYDPALNPHI